MQPQNHDIAEQPATNRGAVASEASSSWVKQLFRRLSIRQKIGFGYGLAIGVAIIGTTAGQILGEHYERRAYKQYQLASEEEHILKEMKIAVLEARSHQQQMIPLMQDHKLYKQEHTHFLNYIGQINKVFSEIKYYVNKNSTIDPDIALVQEWLKTYDGTAEAYSQQIELVLKRIDSANLQPGTVPAAQRQLLEFTNSEVALKFDRLSDDLTDLIEAAHKEEHEAEEALDKAEALQTQIINLSLLVSLVTAAALAFYTSRAIARPLEAVTKVAQKATEEANFNLQAPVTTADEIGVLATSFNNLIRRVAEYTQELETARQTLEARVEERTAALHESESRLYSILNSLQDVVWSTTVDNFTLLYQNPAGAILYGRSLEDFFDNPFIWQEAIYPEDRDYVALHSQKLREVGSYEMDYRIVRPNGEVRWTHNRAWMIYDNNGTPIRIDGMITDITDRKQAEAALQQAEARARQQASQLEQALSELRQTQSQLIQTEKMSSLGQMVAGVAHEINNPVNFIHGNIDHVTNYFQDLLNLISLYQQRLPSTDAEIADEIEAIDFDFLIEDLPKTLESMKIGTDRIRQIVLSLRNFSRLDEAEVKSVNIHEGIDSTLLILNHRIKQGIEVFKHYGDVPLVKCYPAQINQVFMNILNNAIDALFEQPNQTSKQIVIQTEVVNAVEVMVRIKDNGPGISAEAKNKLFDPFFTTKAVGKGTGLGLSICYQIVEKHGGKIEVVSEPGQGTEFAIALPIQPRRSPSVVNAAAASS